jgi:hypothetical protein
MVIGIALMLSVSNPLGSKPDNWQTFRLFMMPFCVSSFSSLIKGKGYIFVIPPNTSEQIISVGACLSFILFVYSIKALKNRAIA